MTRKSNKVNGSGSNVKSAPKGRRNSIAPSRRLYVTNDPYDVRDKPAAQVKTNNARFFQRKMSDNSIRVTGYDLIYSTTETIVEGPFCVVTCNPAYWEGTRIGTIANSYSQYRPLHLRMDYYPQVSTMTSGNVVTGTLWNNVSSGDNIQQVLATSNGGRIFPVYESERIEIKLKTNLNQNLYNFQGYLDTDTNPFVFIAITQQTNNITPGYFMISYQYEFKNPLGEGFDYSTEVKTAADIDKDDVWETTSAVLLSSTTVAAIGTRLVVKIIDDTIQFFLGGSRVGVLADTIFKLFRSRPKKTTKMQEEIIDLSQSNYIPELSVTLEPMQQGSSVTQVFELPQGQRLTLDNFVDFDEHTRNVDYKAVGGLFIQLKQVGTGRYNLGMYALSNCVDDLRGMGLYILKAVNGNITDYSCVTQLDNLVIGLRESRCTACTVLLQFEDNPPLEATVPIQISVYDAKPVVIADVALLTTEQAFGVGSRKVVGQGDVILIPTKSWKLSGEM